MIGVSLLPLIIRRILILEVAILQDLQGTKENIDYKGIEESQESPGPCTTRLLSRVTFHKSSEQSCF